MSRGRLIQRFLAVVYRLDRVAMRGGEPDVDTGIASGYDDILREPVIEDDDLDRIGEVLRRELDPVQIPCQVEAESFEQLRMLAGGNSPSSDVQLIFHYKDLLRLELLDDGRQPLLLPGDRLDSILTTAGQLAFAFAVPPGLYLTQIMPRGWGLSRSGTSQLNLAFCRWQERRTSAERYE